MSLTEQASTRAIRARAAAVSKQLRDDWLYQCNSIICNLGITVTHMTQSCGLLAGFTVFVAWDSTTGVVHSFDNIGKLEAWLDERWSVLTGGD